MNNNFIFFIFSISILLNISKAINYYIKFTCGNEPADGRVIIWRFRAAGPILNEPIVLLDALVKNGIFEGDVEDAGGAQQSLHVFFRTNCYILNRKEECCAHDFRFAGCYSGLGDIARHGPRFFECTTREKENCGDNSWIKYPPGGTFSMFDPLKKRNYINLLDLLLKANEYSSKFMLGPCNTDSVFQSARSCVKANNKEIRICGNKNVETQCKNVGFDKMEICDHPYYGLTNFTKNDGNN